MDHKILAFFRFITTAFFGFLLFSNIFRTDITYNALKTRTQLFALIITLFFFGFICFLVVKLLRKPNIRSFLINKKYWILALGMLLIFILQLLYIRQIYGSVGWDVEMVVKTAIHENPSEKSSYFSKYSNNLFLMFFFRVIHLITSRFGFTDIWWILSVINVLFVNAAILFIVLSAKRLFGIKGFYVSWFLSTAFFSFSPWLVIPYSDTMSMPFIIAAFYILIRTKFAPPLIKNVPLLLLTGALTAIGYFIKPSSCILLLALAFTYLLHFHCGKKEWLSRLLTLAVCLVSFFFLVISFQIFINKQNTIPINRSKSIPMTHFIMMGMTKTERGDGRYLYGAWNQMDVDITMKGKTTEEKREINKREITKRLRDYGFTGYVRFLYHKAIWITSDGTFFWGGEGGFMEMKHSDGVFAQFHSPNGKYFRIYAYVAQGIWLLILLFFVLSLSVPDKETRFPIPIYLNRFLILGIISFVLLFEGRSRYLINHLPFFTLAAVQGILYCWDKIFISAKAKLGLSS